MAGGLAYFFLLSLFPLLLVLATLLGFLPVPDLFNQGIEIMSKFVPGDSMGLVRETLKGILSPTRGDLLSVGILGTLFTASGGFSALIDALDIAYDAKQSRSWIRQRLLALWLTFLVGGSFTLGLIATVVGPEFGAKLSKWFHLSGELASAWPGVRWAMMFVSVVLAIELLYFLGPNVKQRFKETLPGATVAVAVWLLASYLLGIYVKHFGNYNKTYGSLGAVIALMLWLYVTSMIILRGGGDQCGAVQATRRPARWPDSTPGKSPIAVPPQGGHSEDCKIARNADLHASRAPLHRDACQVRAGPSAAGDRVLAQPISRLRDSDRCSGVHLGLPEDRPAGFRHAHFALYAA